MGLSGADLEYRRQLVAAGLDTSQAAGKGGADLEKEGDERFVNLGGFGGGSSVPPADTVTPGKVQLATTLEATAGTDATKAVTPAALKAVADTKALDSSVVHKASNETITGVKTFSANPVFAADAIPQAAVASLAPDLSDLRTDMTTLEGNLGNKQDIDKVYYNYTTNSWPARPASANPITWISTKGVVATPPPGSAVDGDSWKVTPGQTVV